MCNGFPGGQELADCVKGRKKIELNIFLPAMFAYTHGVWEKACAQQGPRGDDVAQRRLVT